MSGSLLHLLSILKAPWACPSKSSALSHRPKEHSEPASAGEIRLGPWARQQGEPVGCLGIASPCWVELLPEEGGLQQKKVRRVAWVRQQGEPALGLGTAVAIVWSCTQTRAAWNILAFFAKLGKVHRAHSLRHSRRLAES
eukprot:1160135-Pelagomonas_calceolata.AAC.10